MPAFYPITANTTLPLTPEFQFWKCNATGGAFTVTLPDATKCLGMEACLMKSDSSANAVSIATTSSQTITTTSGAATTGSLAAQGNAITVVSDGANWMQQSKV